MGKINKWSEDYIKSEYSAGTYSSGDNRAEYHKDFKVKGRDEHAVKCVSGELMR